MERFGKALLLGLGLRGRVCLRDPVGTTARSRNQSARGYSGRRAVKETIDRRIGAKRGHAVRRRKFRPIPPHIGEVKKLRGTSEAAVNRRRVHLAILTKWRGLTAKTSPPGAERLYPRRVSRSRYLLLALQGEIALSSTSK